MTLITSDSVSLDCQSNGWLRLIGRWLAGAVGPTRPSDLYLHSSVFPFLFSSFSFVSARVVLFYSTSRSELILFYLTVVGSFVVLNFCFYATCIYFLCFLSVFAVLFKCDSIVWLCCRFCGTERATRRKQKEEKQTRSQKNENKMKGNKAVDLQLQTEKHLHILCVCVCVCVCVCCRGISSRPSSGNSPHPSRETGERGKSDTKRNQRERGSSSHIKSFIFLFLCFCSDWNEK